MIVTRNGCFDKFVQWFGLPYYDLFVSRLNYQITNYVSWRPDPDTIDIDAFTLNWDDKYMYMFPPFSVISRVLQKMDADKGDAILIASLWTTQCWFPRLLKMLVDCPRILPTNRLLQLPQAPATGHPLKNKLHLTAFRLSGNSCKTKAFLRGLRTFS